MLLLFSPCFRACRCWLYGAVLEKSKGAAAGAPAKGSIKGALVPTPRAQVVRVPTSAGRLTKLLERFRWYKYDIMQMLLKVCVGPHRGLIDSVPWKSAKTWKNRFTVYSRGGNQGILRKMLQIREKSGNLIGAREKVVCYTTCRLILKYYVHTGIRWGKMTVGVRRANMLVSLVSPYLLQLLFSAIASKILSNCKYV